MKLLTFALVIAGCAKPPDIDEVRLQPCRVDEGARVIDLDYDHAGHLIARREHDGAATQTWTFRYAGDRVVDQIHDGAVFHFERDADGHHVATTLRQHTTWRGAYRDGRLAVSTDIRMLADGSDVPGTSTAYAYDRYGRVTRATTSLSIGGTITRTFEYGGSTCHDVRDPLALPDDDLFEPCPTKITTVDAQGTRVSRPIYRDGRLVQDDNFTYSFDDAGRLVRQTSLRVPDRAYVFSYSCRVL